MSDEQDRSVHQPQEQVEAPADGEERAATPADAPEYVPVAEGSTNQPTEPVPSEEEQVASLQQTPAEELAVDPNIEQPSQVPTDVVDSDPGAEDEE